MGNMDQSNIQNQFFIVFQYDPPAKSNIFMNMIKETQLLPISGTNIHVIA